MDGHDLPVMHLFHFCVQRTHKKICPVFSKHIKATCQCQMFTKHFERYTDV
jgi:hypothetical protein